MEGTRPVKNSSDFDNGKGEFLIIKKGQNEMVRDIGYDWPRDEWRESRWVVVM